MKKRKNKGNPVILWLLLSFLMMVIVIGATACYYAYRQKNSEILTDLDKRLFQFGEECKEISDDFWALYLPIFERNEYEVYMSQYFVEKTEKGLSPMEKREFAEMLLRIASQDSKVQWIVVYSPLRVENYIFFPIENTLKILPDDFAYFEELNGKKTRMEIYAGKEIKVDEFCYESIVISGGAPGDLNSGSIMVGYDISRLDYLCEKDINFESLRFDFLIEGREIYSSTDDWMWTELKPVSGTEKIYQKSGEKWYVQTSKEHESEGTIAYSLKLDELFASAYRSSIPILSVTLLMMVLSICLCLLSMNSVTKEAKIIHDALGILGTNQLDYSIEYDFKQPEFITIAESINQMSRRLKENIERAKMYERKQNEAEMQELQAKFNPHFLNNTLEIFRHRCYENGDEETAEMIAQTATIFRGYISPKTFIPIQEELAAAKRYLSLFRARYGDSVKVLYDIDTEVLQYGIIRNVFQPLIENYFEHGYDPSRDDNYILFKGNAWKEDKILFLIKDNGFGMDEKELTELNKKLQRSIQSEEESYGLKNLYQRLKLFYGDDCGMKLYKGKDDGMVIEMIIKRIKCES